MFRKKPKYGVKVIIFDERAEGGIEYSEDVARRLVDKGNPGKTFYYLKKRKIRTKPSEFYKLVPGPKGKKVMPLWGVSHDELFPLAFKNITTAKVQATNEFGQPLFYKTDPVQAKNEQNQLLFFETDEKKNPKETTTTDKTDFPVIDHYDILVEEKEYQAADEDGNLLYFKADKHGKKTKHITLDKTEFPALEKVEKVPVMTTTSTQYPVTHEKPVKIVEPTPANLRFWLARTQEEDKIKYENRSWFDKYGSLVVLATVGCIMMITILFALFGISEMIGNIEIINEGFHATANAMNNVADKIGNMAGQQTIGTVLGP